MTKPERQHFIEPNECFLQIWGTKNETRCVYESVVGKPMTAVDCIELLEQFDGQVLPLRLNTETLETHDVLEELATEWIIENGFSEMARDQIFDHSHVPWFVQESKAFNEQNASAASIAEARAELKSDMAREGV